MACGKKNGGSTIMYNCIIVLAYLISLYGQTSTPSEDLGSFLLLEFN